MDVEPVLIIGAGAAGLAAAAELQSRGVPCRILERSGAVGSSWSSRYDCLQLNTSGRRSRLRPRDPREASLPRFPSRLQFVSYLESFAHQYGIQVRFGVEVTRLDPCPEGWLVSTTSGPLTARQVIVAVGARHTPWLPDWAVDAFPGRVLHSVDYHNAEPFAGLDVLVVGGGCSGLDIARDLAQNGARSVRLAVRSHPMLLTKSSLGIPTDALAAALFRVPPRIADTIGKIVQRLTVGDLRRWGLQTPEGGVITRLRRGMPPEVVTPEVIAAIKARDFDIVAAVDDLDGDGAHLADGTTLQPDVIVAATGFGTGLEPLVGHLGVLDGGGRPLHYEGISVRPGLRFIGYHPCLDVIRHHAPKVGEHLHAELMSAMSTGSAVADIAPRQLDVSAAEAGQ